MTPERTNSECGVMMQRRNCHAKYILGIGQCIPAIAANGTVQILCVALGVLENGTGSSGARLNEDMSIHVNK